MHGLSRWGKAVLGCIFILVGERGLASDSGLQANLFWSSAISAGMEFIVPVKYEKDQNYKDSERSGWFGSVGAGYGGAKIGLGRGDQGVNESSEIGMRFSVIGVHMWHEYNELEIGDEYVGLELASALPFPFLDEIGISLSFGALWNPEENDTIGMFSIGVAL